MIEIKTVQCLEFEYKCPVGNGELMLQSELQFTAQTPKDESLLERAILVQFEVKSPDDNFKLKCVCRVVFAFEKREELLEGKDLLQARQQEAYTQMQKMAQAALESLGQEGKIFPDFDFD